jgi:hypothetical protein
MVDQFEETFVCHQDLAHKFVTAHCKSHVRVAAAVTHSSTLSPKSLTHFLPRDSCLLAVLDPIDTSLEH